jgi:type IV pilus assembly protein PilX
VVSLVVMLLMAIIALSLLGSNTIQELLAGNLSEKTRALQAANSALNYGEAWVAQNPSAGIPCTAGTTSTTPVVCDANSPAPGTLAPNDLTLPTSSGTAIGNVYQPAGMVASTSGGANTVYQLPRYYIQYVGLVADSNGTVDGTLYKITAAGYGGNANAVAIVQAYYRVYSPSTNVMGP